MSEGTCVHCGRVFTSDLTVAPNECELCNYIRLNVAETNNLRAENEKLRELVRQAMDSQGPLSAAKWYANAAKLLGRE